MAFEAAFFGIKTIQALHDGFIPGADEIVTTIRAQPIVKIIVGNAVHDGESGLVKPPKS